MRKWLMLAKMIGPMIILVVKPELAPVMSDIVDAIAEAEQIKGANGKQKLVHVVRVADKAIAVANKAGAKIEVTSAHDAVVEATEAVVAGVNAVEKSQALAAGTEKPPAA